MNNEIEQWKIILKGKVMKLFLMESFDHGEDWFVVATHSREAMSFFADNMGYEIIYDEVSAQFVCDVPAEFDYQEADFADEEVITACSGEMRLFDDRDLRPFCDDKLLLMMGVETRVVKIDEVIYVEGNVMRSALQHYLP